MATKKKYDRIPEAHNSGGYHFSNPEEIAEQRGVIWEMAKQIATNLTQGVNLVSISLPVRLFEPRSYLQRITDSWCYAPVYLTKAAAATDPVERLKYVITFAISGLHNTCKQKKPFNPILGETFEATYEDGTQICCEQSSHHPPVTAWQVFGPNESYKFYGYGEWGASFYVNSVTGSQKGTHVVEFKDGTKITYNLPPIVLKGIVMGERIMEYSGKIQFVDHSHGLVADISIPPEEGGGGILGWFSGSSKSPSDYLKGTIYKEGAPETPLVEIGGSWLGVIEFNGVPTWSVNDKLPVSTPIPVANPLPSDARFRADLVALKEGDLTLANDSKSKLENVQRRDAKLRKEAAAARGDTAHH